MQRILFCLFFIILYAGQIFSVELSEKIEKKYSAKELSSIKLSNLNGDVRITGKKTEEIKVTAYKFVYSRNKIKAKKQLEELKVEFEIKGQKLIVYSKFPEEDNEYGSFFNKKNHRQKTIIDYEIVLPEKFNIELKTTNGEQVLKNITGEVLSESVNGNIKAINLAGDMEISSVNGNLTAYLENEKEIKRVNLHTVNGRLILKMPCKTGCSIIAETVNGHINAPRSIKLDRRRNGHEASGEINGGGIPVKLKTVNGSIEFVPI